jgi:hypothetical protein
MFYRVDHMLAVLFVVVWREGTNALDRKRRVRRFSYRNL